MGVTAKERLRRAVDELTEREASVARIVVERDDHETTGNMVELPEGWNRTVSGRPMPDIVAALDRSRAGR